MSRPIFTQQIWYTCSALTDLWRMFTWILSLYYNRTYLPSSNRINELKSKIKVMDSSHKVGYTHIYYFFSLGCPRYNATIEMNSAVLKSPNFGQSYCTRNILPWFPCKSPSFSRSYSSRNLFTTFLCKSPKFGPVHRSRNNSTIFLCKIAKATILGPPTEIEIFQPYSHATVLILVPPTGVETPFFHAKALILVPITSTISKIFVCKKP